MDGSTFFNQLLGSITGQSKTELSQQALQIQEQLAKDTLAAEIEAQKLKYNPELSKQRTIQIALVGVPILIIAGIFIYIKFIK